MLLWGYSWTIILKYSLILKLFRVETKSFIVWYAPIGLHNICTLKFTEICQVNMADWTNVFISSSFQIFSKITERNKKVPIYTIQHNENVKEDSNGQDR